MPSMRRLFRRSWADGQAPWAGATLRESHRHTMPRAAVNRTAVLRSLRRPHAFFHPESPAASWHCQPQYCSLLHQRGVDALPENPSRALAASSACVQSCHAHFPALLLCIAAQRGADTVPAKCAEDVFDAFHRYATNSDCQGSHPLESPAREPSDGGRHPLLTTELGVLWVQRETAAPSASEGRAAAHYLRLAAQVPEFPPAAVAKLVHHMVDACRASCVAEGELCDAVLASLATACPIHVASITRGLQCHSGEEPRAVDERVLDGVREGTRAGLPLSRWRSGVPPALAKRCLQHVADTIREQRGRRDTLPRHVLQALHTAALCQLPDGLASSDTLRTELAILSMTALKYASFPQLECLCRYLEAEHATAPAVLNKFLANCGILLGDADARRRVGTVLHNFAGGDTDHAGRKADSATVVGAVRALARSGRDVRYVEEGLVHGCSVLSALGCHAEVKAVYCEFPTLRATPHLVAMHVAEKDVHGVIQALNALATGRPEGWVRLPPIIQQTVAQACELVGLRGSPADVEPLYKAIVRFHNAGMIISQSMESVFAGVCQRMRDVVDDRHDSDVALAPRAVLERVIPMVKILLMFVGDDLNTDAILTLLETSLETGSMAVPLTTALMLALRRSTSLSIRELFTRVDHSTHNIPFLYYYVLCFARDRGLVDLVEHLSVVWCVDSQPILERHAHLAPPYKLWKCASCGRLNSDRFNYCVCSALRNGFVMCGTCGYGQDERWPTCLSCGDAVDRASAAGGVVRKAWTCAACNAANPARQMLLCFRCARPTGPLCRAAAGDGAASSHAESPFCMCSGEAEDTQLLTYRDRVGCCRQCGKFRGAEAARTSAVWTCVGCEQLRSTLERSCPSCPQVDCLPFAMEHTAGIVRFCRACGSKEENVFVSACSTCGSADLRATMPEVKAGASQVSHSFPHSQESRLLSTGRGEECCVLCCPHCGETQLMTASSDETTRQETPSCRSCKAALSVHADGVGNRVRVCPSCQKPVPPTVVASLCPHCASYVPLPSILAEWQAPHIQQTCAMMRKYFGPSQLPLLGGEEDGSALANDGSGGQPPERRLDKLRAFLTELRHVWTGGENDGKGALRVSTLSGVRVEVLLALHDLLRALKPAASRDPVARRCAAQIKQLMTWIDRRCGVTESNHFDAEEVCHECLGGHPVELCVHYGSDASASFTWTCSECGVSNTNEDVCRYLCTTCLSLRPVVQDMFPTECWECRQCHRANVEFETFCVHCGVARPARAVSDVAAPLPSEGTGGTPEECARANHIPFLPSRCALCGLVYLETHCPLCTNHRPDVAEAKGVVCAVGTRHAYIQPLGSTRAEDRIFVGEQLLRGVKLHEGEVVHYLTERRGGDHGVGFTATHLR